MRDRIVTLKNFNNPVEAKIVKARLESAGIPCMLTDENIVGINPIFDHSLGGTKLKVFVRDLERAKVVLGDME